jgi:ABC-type phosphate/phosphonate transport system substrate-binding protein
MGIFDSERYLAFKRVILPAGVALSLILAGVGHLKDLRDLSCSTFRFCLVVVHDPDEITTTPTTGVVVPIPNSLKTNHLTIGILSKPENYQPLLEYLKGRFGSQVNIEIEGDDELSYQQARDQISAKHWDLVFTLSPMLSYAAQKRGYHFVGRMFPKNLVYQSVIFVRKDSQIQSLADLGSKTRIALGGFNSASSFYMPAYDLAGKELTVDMGHRGPQIKEMVRNGQADAGAGAYGDLIKPENQDLRIIHQSRDIPGSAVYLSPNIDDADVAILTQVLLEAPQSIRDEKHANYGAGSPADYTKFIEIAEKVEELLRCSNFNQQPVRFFCPTGAIVSPSLTNTSTIYGEVNGWSKPTAETVLLTVIDNQSNTYHVQISQSLLQVIPGFSNMVGLQHSKVRIETVVPELAGNKLYNLSITSEKQFSLLD